MLSRRDTLKLAAAAAAARSLTPSVTTAEAARLLGEPATPVSMPGLLGFGGTPDLADPVSFAVETDGSIAEELVNYQAPEELAAYVQARAAVLHDLPLLAGVRYDHPWYKMDEAAYAWAGAAYLQGVAAGAAYENLRRALVGATRSCPRCFGVGRLDARGRGATNGGGETCPGCHGAGTVPVPATSVTA